MIEKTLKGKLKKVGFYALCYSPIVLSIASFGFVIGGCVVSSNYDKKKKALRDYIYPNVLVSEEFKAYKQEKEEKLLYGLEAGIITPQECVKKLDELTKEYNVLEYAKTLSEYSADVVLAEEYDKKASDWCWSLAGFVPTTVFAIGGTFSIIYAKESYKNFDNDYDLEKQKKRLQAKQQKLAKKEKEL